MTPERTEKLQKVLRKRQADMTLVLENVHDPHNISAVMRTCESVGIQDLFVLNTRLPTHKKFGERSSSSALKWLTIHQYDNAEACFGELRKRNFRIYTTWLGDGSADLYEMDFTTPVAIVFGNEKTGVSDEIRALADGNMVIPQVGIIQSLNISVACAVTVYEAFRQKRLAGHYEAPRLPEQRYDELWQLWSENRD
ncbi:MAG: RNA methyltransferase [Bacteroidota bacterium]